MLKNTCHRRTLGEQTPMLQDRTKLNTVVSEPAVKAQKAPLGTPRYNRRRQTQTTKKAQLTPIQPLRNNTH